MSSATRDMGSILTESLWTQDPELFELIKKEKKRQICGLEMIASENFTSRAVLECLSSCLHNKYSEGLPGQRYYGGNTYIDAIELLCQKRALDAFGLDPEKWGVNVQPYSGSPANLAVYTGLIEPNGRIMGLDLPDGGHLTHGFMTATKKISATSMFFQSMPYKVNPETGYIDYEKLADSARLFHPKVVVAGISCYSRCLDYKRFREIADENDAYLFADMSHVSGLVAAKLIPSPFEYSDVVSTTTHKTLRGPRAGMIFFRKGVRKILKNGDKVMYDLESRINQAVFPGLQGGPHNNKIAAIATALKQVATPDFVKYQTQVSSNSCACSPCIPAPRSSMNVARDSISLTDLQKFSGEHVTVVNNAKKLCSCLQNLGYKIATGGTEVHLVLVDLKSVGLTGARGEYILEEINIACNKNTVPGDKSALNPSGIRLGTPALTTRGLVEKDIEQVVEFIHRALLLAKEIQKVSGPKLVDFKRVIHEDPEFVKKVGDLRDEVCKFSEGFPLPGLDEY
ncbi:hypothetical protein RUM44_004919 [Polyplax serrata]|uniref:Serine hydroxymethyltransferase n=1 Tax=Polyplax serrata TaxID=468196 RepID=A0ABR1B5X6_POLSC